MDFSVVAENNQPVRVAAGRNEYPKKAPGFNHTSLQPPATLSVSIHFVTANTITEVPNSPFRMGLGARSPLLGRRDVSAKPV